MSGGHWNYQGEQIEAHGDYVKSVCDLLVVFEHELDWGICNDTCLACTKLRVAEALICFFDGAPSAAMAIARDRKQNRCKRCTDPMEPER